MTDNDQGITVFDSKNVNEGVVITNGKSINNYGLFNQSFVTDVVTTTVDPDNIYIDTTGGGVSSIYVKNGSTYSNLFGKSVVVANESNLKQFSTIPQLLVVNNYTLQPSLASTVTNAVTIFCRPTGSSVDYSYVNEYIVAVNGKPINGNNMSITEGKLTFNSLFSLTTNGNQDFNNVLLQDVFNVLEPSVLQRMFSSYGLPTMASEIVTLKNEIDGLRSVVKELCGRCYTFNTTANKTQINEMYNRYDKYGDGYTELVDVPSGFNFKTYNQQQWEDANYRLFNMQKYANNHSNSLSQLCNGNGYITNIDLSLWDVNMVLNISNMFSGCSSLTEINLQSWNTIRINNMSGMFNGCSS